jgi:hypothetical protein
MIRESGPRLCDKIMLERLRSRMILSAKRCHLAGSGASAQMVFCV